MAEKGKYMKRIPIRELRRGARRPSACKPRTSKKRWKKGDCAYWNFAGGKIAKSTAFAEVSIVSMVSPSHARVRIKGMFGSFARRGLVPVSELLSTRSKFFSPANS